MKFLYYFSPFYRGKILATYYHEDESPGLLMKAIMRMHIIFFLILITCLNVFSKEATAQISLHIERGDLETVFKAIEKQTDYSFMYEVSLLKGSRVVSIDVKGAGLKEVLDEVFRGQPFYYEVISKTIVVKEKVNNSVARLHDEKKTILIKGKVTDKQNTPLVGVSVRIKGTNTGTLTDQNGNYTITADPNGVIIFSYVGYRTFNIMINGQTEINMTLVENTSQLEETVVKGYYTTTKALNTGSVSSIKAADITKQPVGDPLMALQGRISGLSIIQSSGIPGNSFTVRLRGQNSISNGNDPLYIVDGVPFDHGTNLMNQNALEFSTSPLLNIRPEDIESIDVLKDADATAIYGSRGANGVVLITTKKGREQKVQFDVKLTRGAGKITKQLQLLNTEQYLTMRKEAFTNDGTNPQSFEYDVNGKWDQTKYTDWQKIMIGGTAEYTNANASLSGGNGQTNFLLNGTFRKENTIFPGDYGLEVYGGKVNINHNSVDGKLDLNFNVNYSALNNRLPRINFIQYIFYAPNAPSLFKDNGDLNWENSTFTNPFGELKKSSLNKTDNFVANLNIVYKIVEGLALKVASGYNKTDINEVNLIPFVAFNPAATNPSTRRQNLTSSLKTRSWIVEPQLTYSRAIGSHNFDILVGTSFQERISTGNSITATGFATDVLIQDLGAATTFTNVFNSYTLYRYNALFGRIGYNYKQKYIANITARRDGSSRFGPGNQFGNFGAVGTAWNFAKENFVKQLLPVLSSGKIRGSIGRTGNDQLIDYQYLSLYRSLGLSYLGSSTLNPDVLSNSQYGWETINKLEFGIELGFVDDKIQLTSSFYRNRTSNQLVGYNLPSITGFGNIVANLPAVIENKGIEFDINTLNIESSKFTWKSFANISFPKNKLISYPNIQSSPYANIYKVGEPLFINFLYSYTGINPNTGTYSFRDFNNDGIINSANDREPVFVGQTFFGGIGNSLKYGGFSLDIFIQFVKQKGYRFFASRSPGTFTTTNSNQPTKVLNRWSSDATASKYQKYTSLTSGPINTAFDNFNASDYHVGDASFIRLKNIMLSWDLPTGWKRAIRFHEANVFLQGQNLLTYTNYDGLDPENTTSGNIPSLPPLRLVAVGVQIGL